MKKHGPFALFSIIFILVNVCCYIFMQGENVKGAYTALSDILAIAASFAAVLGVMAAVFSFRSYDLVKRSWFVLLIGMLLYFFAETVYAVYDVVLKMDMDLFFPTPADSLWVIGYIPLIAAVTMLLWGYRKSGFPMGSKKFYIVLFSGAAILFYSVWLYLLMPIFSDKQSTEFERFVYVSYLAGDFILVTCCAVLAYITSLFKGGALSVPWRYIAMGFIFITAADIVYSYLTWQGDYDVGGLIDISWNIGYLLIAAAGFHQKGVVHSINKAG